MYTYIQTQNHTQTQAYGSNWILHQPASNPEAICGTVIDPRLSFPLWGTMSLVRTHLFSVIYPPPCAVTFFLIATPLALYNFFFLICIPYFRAYNFFFFYKCLVLIFFFLTKTFFHRKFFLQLIPKNSQGEECLFRTELQERQSKKWLYIKDHQKS